MAAPRNTKALTAPRILAVSIELLELFTLRLVICSAFRGLTGTGWVKGEVLIEPRLANASDKDGETEAI